LSPGAAEGASAEGALAPPTVAFIVVELLMSNVGARTSLSGGRASATASASDAIVPRGETRTSVAGIALVRRVQTASFPRFLAPGWVIRATPRNAAEV
jgi:hypothetical protein